MVKEASIGLRQLDYSQRRYFVDQFYFREIPLLAPKSLLLDLGGHKVHKRGQFNLLAFDQRVVYVNLTTDKSPDIQADAINLPFPKACFDAVICAELLEHVSNPIPVLNEVHRVMRPQGSLFITVPFLYHIHGDPYDYGRYTDFYWRENLAKIGFGNIYIEKQGLFWSVLVDMLRDWANQSLTYGNRRLFIFRRLIIRILAWLRRKALQWDEVSQQHSYFNSFTTGFGIRCIKP